MFTYYRTRSLFTFVAAIGLFLCSTATTSAQVWIFTSTDGADTAAGTLMTDTTWDEAQGSGQITVTVTQLLSLEINGIDVGIDSIEFEPRTGGSNDFTWDRDAQDLIAGTGNHLIFDPATGYTRTFQIGHGLTQSGGARYRTFTAGTGWDSFDIDFDATSTSYAPSAVPEPSTYAALFGGIALVGAVWNRRRQNRANA